jgi:hypothetical protein
MPCPHRQSFGEGTILYPISNGQRRLSGEARHKDVCSDLDRDEFGRLLRLRPIKYCPEIPAPQIAKKSSSLPLLRKICDAKFPLKAFLDTVVRREPVASRHRFISTVTIG